MTEKKNPKNPWHSAQWKQMREEVLSDKCDQCGATDRTLVAQHTWHPTPYAQVKREVASSLGLPENHPKVNTKAYEIYQSNHERYMSGADVITYCDKCAYMWDKLGMKLCSECKDKYHLFKYKSCKRCADKARDRKIYGKDLFEQLDH